MKTSSTLLDCRGKNTRTCCYEMLAMTLKQTPFGVINWLIVKSQFIITGDKGGNAKF